MAWWPWETDGTNLTGSSVLTFAGVPGYVPAVVGRGLEFDGDESLRGSASAELDVGSGGGFTIELWVRPEESGLPMPLLEWNDGGANLGVQFWLWPPSGSTLGSVFGSVTDRNGGQHPVGTPGCLVSGEFAHVALTYDRSSGTARILVNGEILASSNLGSLDPDTRWDLWVGQRPQGDHRYYGVMDEIALYARALAPGEVALIAAAGSEGKCRSAIPPALLSQPEGRTVFAGVDVTFAVQLVGDPPVRIQWWFDDEPLVGATNAVLVLPEVRPEQAGRYQLTASNSVAVVTSAVARLVVNVPGVCTPAPEGLVAWWPLDDSGVDALGRFHGTLLGSPEFRASADQRGLFFDRLDDGVRIPASLVFEQRMSNGFTIELWVQPDPAVFDQPLLEWADGGQVVGVTLWQGLAGRGSLYANLIDTAGAPHAISTSSGWLSNDLAHVALTYDRAAGVAKIYVNGIQAGAAELGSFTPDMRWDLHFGRRPFGAGSSHLFGGWLDEVSFYGRALTGPELLQIASVAGAGKCGDLIPPAIVEPPRSLTGFVGGDVTFAVTARGGPPLRYQWRRDGVPLPGAEASSLRLTNLPPAAAGPYDVLIWGPGGSVTSAVVTLGVLPPGTCIPSPPDLVAWWPLQFTGDDVVGSARLTLEGQPGFEPGLSGRAMRYDGRDDFAWVPFDSALDLGSGPGLTVDFWMWTAAAAAAQPLIEWHNNLPNGVGVTIWTSVSQAGSIYLNLIDTRGGSHAFSTAAGSLSNGWTHVAVTYQRSSGLAEIFLNGELATRRNVGSFTPETRRGVYFGARPPIGGPQYLFKGLLDEVGFYSRALVASEVQVLHRAGSAGRCRAPIPPAIVESPADVTLFRDETARFKVGAIGDLPLFYQWRREDQPLAGATNALLILTNVVMGQAGRYTVVVTNVGGAVTSGVAMLAVREIPPCVSAPGSLAGWWPLDGSGIDLAAGSAVQLATNSGFARAKVGDGLRLGPGDAVKIPAGAGTDVGLGPGMTVEFWIQPDDLTNQAAVIEWNNGAGSVGVHLWIAVPGAAGGAGPGSILASLTDVFRQPHVLLAPGVSLTNRLHHVALTYDRAAGVAKIHVDGAVVATKAVGDFPPDTRYDVHLGRRPTANGGEAPFSGLLDELSFYSRALGDDEIARLAAAGPAGKCREPIPPAIVRQPEATSVFQGDNLSLSVQAAGALPLTYQWFVDGAVLVGRTNASLFLTNVQPGQSGLYTVAVTGPAGAVVSRGVAVVVHPLSGCFGPPAGLIAWWPFEGTAADLIGGAVPGTLGAPLYPAGLVGTAVRLDGVDDAFTLTTASNLNVGAGDGFTIETWINPADGLLERPILEWHNRQIGVGVSLWISTGGRPPGSTPGNLFANLIDTNDVAHRLMSANGVIVQDRWQHVALTWQRSNGVTTLYRDGAVVAQQALGTFTPQTAPPYDVFIGWRFPQNSGYYFPGLIDELSIYNRALTPLEIQYVFRTYRDGKCRPVQPPTFSVSPRDQSVLAGEPVVMEVQAEGTPPLTYQWTREDLDLPGATNAQLRLTAARSADAGLYRVRVENRARSVTSAPARLDVVVMRTLALGTAPETPVGSLISMPLTLASTGEVGAMTFVVRYNPDQLAAPDLRWDPSMDAAAREINGSRPGELRGVLALPGTAVPAGTQTIAVVSFRARTRPTAVTSVVEPELVDAARPGGQLLGFGTDVRPGTVRLLPGGGIGDSNGNSRWDIGDVTLLLRLLALLDTTRAWDITRNDLNLNGELDSGDVLLLLQRVAEASGPSGAGLQLQATGAEPSGRLSFVPDRLQGRAGERVTMAVQWDGAGSSQAGLTFDLRYPTRALRLLDATSLVAGPVVPPGAPVVWNVMPGGGFVDQTGRVTFATSSAVSWLSLTGTVAELTFEIQAAAGEQYLWPIDLASAEVTTDGYALVRPARAGSALQGRAPVRPELAIAQSLAIPGSLLLELSGDRGATYAIETSTNLAEWQIVTNVVVVAIPEIVRASGLPPSRQRFFRAAVVR